MFIFSILINTFTGLPWYNKIRVYKCDFVMLCIQSLNSSVLFTL